MIRGQVDLRSLCRPAAVVVTTGQFDRDARSWIEPYRHSLYSVTVESGDNEVAVTVQDRCSSTSGESSWLLAAFSFRQTIQGLTLASIGSPMVPLYYCVTARVAYFSWDPADLASFIPAEDLDIQHCQRFIAGRNGYGASTPWLELRSLTQGESVQISPDGEVASQPPEAAKAYSAATPVPGADLARVLVECLTAAISDVPTEVNLVCELSGGYDSSLSTVAALRSSRNVRSSYGILFPGVASIAQIRRRDAVLAGFQVNDHVIRGARVAFLRPWLGRSPWPNPEVEFYEVLLGAAFPSTFIPGLTAVVTGVGGDEAMLPAIGQDTAEPASSSQDQLRDEVPKTRVPESAVKAAIVRAPVFLRRGIVPLNPYCSRIVTEFSELLPDAFKVHRRTQKDALRALGLTDLQLQRPVPENFGSLLRAEYEKVLSARDPTRPVSIVDLGVLTGTEWETLTSGSPMRMSKAQLDRSVRAYELETSIRSLMIAGAAG